MKTDNGCPNYLSNNSAKQLAERTGRNVEIGLMDIEGKPLDIFILSIRSLITDISWSFSFYFFVYVLFLLPSI